MATQTGAFVPAWKRLGLQLKRPSEVSTPDANDHTQPAAKRQKNNFGQGKASSDSAARSEVTVNGKLADRSLTRDESETVSTSVDRPARISPLQDQHRQKQVHNKPDAGSASSQLSPPKGVKRGKKVTFSDSPKPSVHDASIGRENAVTDHTDQADGASTQQKLSQRKQEKRAKRAARQKNLSSPSKIEEDSARQPPPLPDDSKATCFTFTLTTLSLKTGSSTNIFKHRSSNRSLILTGYLRLTTRQFKGTSVV